MTSKDFWSKFYWGDWRKDAKLARCGWAAKGALMDFLAFAFDSEEPGYAVEGGEALSVEDIALVMTGDPKEYADLLRLLLKQKILLLDERNAIYSKRMAEDFHMRSVRKAAGASGGRKTQDLLKQKDKQTPKPLLKQASNSNS
ncbi:hypothetical protein N9878_02200, partial [bacterium]|nr:hypothetical protein [bacterium]